MKLVYKCGLCGRADAAEYTGVLVEPKDILGMAYDFANMTQSMAYGVQPFKPHPCNPVTIGVATLVGILEN